jgi:hypothetical protein
MQHLSCSYVAMLVSLLHRHIVIRAYNTCVLLATCHLPLSSFSFLSLPFSILFVMMIDCLLPDLISNNYFHFLSFKTSYYFIN